MLCLAARFALAHVPTYATDGSKCLTWPRVHTTSQVAYLTAEPGTTTGAEIHCSATSCPFDIANNERIDWDVTFKEELDPSTLRLYVGCTGCMPDDPLTIPPLDVQYGEAHLEPFTLTAYHSLEGVDKKFNASLLDPAICPNAHWGIRLVTFANASTIHWGAVVGLGERFTAQELLEFPIYMLRNHAEWNGAGWTILLIAVLVPLLDLVAATVKWCIGEESRRWVPTILSNPTSVRSWVLQIGVWAWEVASTQILVHLLLAQSQARFDYAFFVAIIVVLLIGNGLWWLLTVAIWRAHLYEMGCYSSPWWAFVEIVSGVGALFSIGGGFFFGGAALILDGLLRLLELLPDEPLPGKAEDELALQEL